jgi:hypothetical protein
MCYTPCFVLLAGLKTNTCPTEKWVFCRVDAVGGPSTGMEGDPGGDAPGVLADGPGCPRGEETRFVKLSRLPDDSNEILRLISENRSLFLLLVFLSVFLGLRLW